MFLTTGQHLLDTAQALQSPSAPLDLVSSIEAWVTFSWLCIAAFKPPASAGTPELISDYSTPLQLSLVHQVGSSSCSARHSWMLAGSDVQVSLLLGMLEGLGVCCLLASPFPFACVDLTPAGDSFVQHLCDRAVVPPASSCTARQVLQACISDTVPQYTLTVPRLDGLVRALQCSMPLCALADWWLPAAATGRSDCQAALQRAAAPPAPGVPCFWDEAGPQRPADARACAEGRAQQADSCISSVQRTRSASPLHNCLRQSLREQRAEPVALQGL